MRAPIVLLTPLLLAACSSGGGPIIVQQPAPAQQEPAPDPMPAVTPQPLPPLEVSLGRPVSGKLFVQTNRPAYVAIFEIIPEQSVALVHPSSARQRSYTLSGLSTIPVWWSTQRQASYSPPSSAGGQRYRPGRYIYAVASDEPLDLPDEAFDVGYLRRTLGLRAYRAADPYETMRALSRRFVPDEPDEAWAEDLYVAAPAAASQPTPVVRVYCHDGTVYDVPADMGVEVWCPARPYATASTTGRPPARPDSVLGDNGRRVRVPTKRPGGTRWVDRIPNTIPVDSANGAGRGPSRPGNGRGRGTANPPAHPTHPAHPQHPAHPEHPEHPDHPEHPAHPTAGAGNGARRPAADSAAAAKVPQGASKAPADRDRFGNPRPTTGSSQPVVTNGSSATTGKPVDRSAPNGRGGPMLRGSSGTGKRKGGAQPAPESGSSATGKPAGKGEPKDEAKPEPKGDAQPGAKSESTDGSAADAQPEQKSESSKPDAQDSKSESRGAAKGESPKSASRNGKPAAPGRARGRSGAPDQSTPSDTNP